MTSTIALSRIERTAAARLAESRATIPDFTLETDVDVTELRAPAPAGSSPRPSVNDVVLKACADSLREHDRLRGRFEDGAVVVSDHVNLAFAVATDRGLLVPVIRDADRLSLAELSSRAKELRERAVRGDIGVADMTGGVFTVTNLGMLGVTRFQPVIDPGQCAILAVGCARSVLELRDGQVVERKQMSVTVSADHRVVDGAFAARFLRDLRGRLEQP